jgi:tetratricopeptide (TPR) repeat protein
VLRRRARLSEIPQQKAGPTHLTERSASPDLEPILLLCGRLRERVDSDPVAVAEEAPRLYELIQFGALEKGLFDENQYLLGETALLAARANRYLGKRRESESWLDRAETAFRSTLSPERSLAEVAYIRLVQDYDAHRCQDVLRRLPSLMTTFESLGMTLDVGKCRLLEAVSWKQLGERQKWVEALDRLRLCLETTGAGFLLGHLLIELGEYQAQEGNYDTAMHFHGEALTHLSQANRPIGVAYLKWSVGETLALMGDLARAHDTFISAQRDFETLGIRTYAALVGLVTAENLLAMNRQLEAEVAILRVLPTIEEQKMVPEGFAAVALLQESVRRRKTDPNALRELREHLQATKQP